MIGRRRQPGDSEAQATVGELMFARSVIEEKNEIIDRKDELIRKLASELHEAETVTEDLRLALERGVRSKELMVRNEERQLTVTEIVSEVVRAVADWAEIHGSSSYGLVERLVSLLQEGYGLRIIEDTPLTIDPELHHVVEVDHSGRGEGAIEILSKGYRIGDTVIRPALVRVVFGVRSMHSPSAAGARLERYQRDGE